MAVWKETGKTITVQKGDSLWAICNSSTFSSYISGSDINAKIATLAKANNIPTTGKTAHIIYVGQILKVSSGGTSSSSSSSSSGTTTNSNKATITAFGLQANTEGRTLYATWEWTKSNTENYRVRWLYGTGDGVAFVISDSTTTEKQSICDIPDNAIRVRFKVVPQSKTKTDKNGNESKYWTAVWSDEKVFEVSDTPPQKPPTPTVELEDNKLTARVDGLNDDYHASQIEFQIVKDDNSIYKNATVDIVTQSASFSTDVATGSEYKVRCRSKKGSLTSDWSDYSSNSSSGPSKPSNITSVVADKADHSVTVKWSAVSNAESYDIEYTTKKKYFDNSDQTTTQNTNTKTEQWIFSNLELGQEYFFRVRAVNDAGHSGWTDIKSVVLGKDPIAPTTWSSTTTAIAGEPILVYWIHNSEDGSSQTYGQVQLTINGTNYTYTKQNSTDEDEKDKTSFLDITTATFSPSLPSNIFTSGAIIDWKVRTKGISDSYGPWSVQRTITVYARPTLNLRVINQNGTLLSTINTFPFYIEGTPGPVSSNQTPIGYHLSIYSNSTYETIDSVGNDVIVTVGSSVYSKYFDTTENLMVEFSANNVDLEQNASYKVVCEVTMSSGLTATDTEYFNVTWEDKDYIPNAEISLDPETITTYIRPYCLRYPVNYYRVLKAWKKSPNYILGHLSGGQESISDSNLEVSTNDYIFLNAGSIISVDENGYKIKICMYSHTSVDYYLDEVRITYWSGNHYVLEEDCYVRLSITTTSEPQQELENTSISSHIIIDDSDTSAYDYIFTDNVLTDVEGESLDNGYTDYDDLVYYDEDNDVYFCIRPNEDGELVNDVKLAVYRREFDGSFMEIGKNIPNNGYTTVSDPHPTLDYARYRIVATDVNTGSISYYDVPGYPVQEKAVIIQWDEKWRNYETNIDDIFEEPVYSGSMLKLPYNIDTSESNDVDVEAIEYIGRKHPVTYYGTQVGQKASWSVLIPKNDVETIYALRRLQVWMGDVYVREPSGTGYWATVSVSFSQKHLDVTIPVSLDIVRVEGGI